MTASTGPNGSARRNRSADTWPIPDASALERPWARGPGDADLSEADHANIEENLKIASGGAAPALSWQTLRELAAATAGGGPEDPDAAARVFAAVESAMALAPRDPLEGMLVAQMAAVNAAAMRCLVRAGECTEYPQIEALYLRLAARLLNLFVRQQEALDRRARQFRTPSEHDRAVGPDAGNTDGSGEGLEILARAVAACQADMEACRREEENTKRGAVARGVSGDNDGNAGADGGPGP